MSVQQLNLEFAMGVARRNKIELKPMDLSAGDGESIRAGGDKVRAPEQAVLKDPEGSVAVPADVATSQDEELEVFLNRLADLLVLPSDHLPPQERALVDELAAGSVSLLSNEYRVKLAERLIKHSSSPPILIRKLLHSEPEAALPVLRSFLTLQESDLISIVEEMGEEHQGGVAIRHFLPSSVCEALVREAPASVLRKMLRNETAKLSRPCFVMLTQKCVQEKELIEPLITRRNFPPDLAHLIFWWAGAKERRHIVSRFACTRDSVHEIMPHSILEVLEARGGSGAIAARMAFQPSKMDRRKTDKALSALEQGHGNDCLDLLAEGMNIKQETAAQILDDEGGEAVAVLAKACGFGRKRLMRLRKILAKIKGKDWDEKAVRDDNVTIVHDLLSTDKADIVLRYWDRTSREFSD